MRKFCLIAAVVFVGLACGRTALAQNHYADIVHTYSNPTANAHCDFVSATKDAITVNTPTGQQSIAVTDIQSIVLEGEPTDMREARVAGQSGDYEKAVDKLSGIKPDDAPRAEVRDELAWLGAFFKAKAVLSDVPGNVGAQKAGGELIKYLKDSPNSMHYYQANETIGDLLASIGSTKVADSFYEKLAQAPLPELVIRAKLLHGRMTLAAKNYDEAMKAFDAVLASPGKGKLGEQQTTEAKIGRTYSLAGSGKFPEAIDTLQKIIAGADDGDTELLARAYNALGFCYHTQKDTKQAIWAYLHVHLMYDKVPDADAEALSNLATLWTESRHPDRAVEAKNDLARLYPNSRWNQKLK